MSKYLTQENYNFLGDICEKVFIIEIPFLILLYFAPNQEPFWVAFPIWFMLLGLKIFFNIKEDRLYAKIQYNRQAVRYE